MPLPTWLARLNRRILNPGAIERGSWPVLVHKGRHTGKTYRTPLGVYRVEDGFLFTINYGSTSDWPLNVVAAGDATLVMDGREISLTEPRIVPMTKVRDMIAGGAKLPPRWVGVENCLVVTVEGTSLG